MGERGNGFGLLATLFRLRRLNVGISATDMLLFFRRPHDFEKHFQDELELHK